MGRRLSDVRAAALGALAAMLAGVVYLNALRNPLVYDDYHTITTNSSIHDVTNLRAIVLHDVTRPLVNFSYAVDRALWGESPFGFHVDSVLLHMLNVVLLFRLAWRLAADRNTGPHVPAFSAAALFAVHPMMTEAVGYISGRSELLVTLWFLAGLLSGRRWLLQGGSRWAAATVAFWVAALVSKETSAMFPFVLFAMAYFTGGRFDTEVWTRAQRLCFPMIAIAVTAGVARLLLLRFEYPDRVAVHWRYLLVELDVVLRYVWLLLRPSGQTLFHEVESINGLFEPRAMLALTLMSATFAAIWRLRSAAPLASFGMVWFLLTLAPSAVLAVLDQGEPMAEHRVYLGSAGFFLAAGIGISHADAWLQAAGGRIRWARNAMMAAVIISLSALTVVRNAVWSDPVALWQESVDLAPTHYRPRLLLGEALQDKGRRNDAIEQYRTAIRLRPSDVDGYIKLGLCLADAARFDEARQTFRQALDVDPDNDAARKALALLEQISAAS